jgi:aminoglycoside phosphotransferase (APT) family kinase protein
MTPTAEPTTAWNGRPPRMALAWVARTVGPGARVVRVRALGGGSWLATHLVLVDDRAGRRHALVLRRWARPGWEREQPTFTAATEAEVLTHLAAGNVPAPPLVAVDPDGSLAGVPALLQARLPGRPPTYPATRRQPVLVQLAAILVTIHALDGGLRGVVPAHRPYTELAAITEQVPATSGRRDLWAEALALAATPAPAGHATFLHRDYHPGNTLWVAGRLTGIVDWTGASWGSPASDLAHLRANLGVGHEPAVADRALAAYEAHGGQAGEQRWWDVRTLLDWVPLLGTRLGTGEGLGRVETWLAHILG